MAKPSEILTTEARQRNIRPGDMLYDVLDTTRGLTEDRREANIGAILGNTLLLKDADYNPDAVVPSLADVLSFYGLKDSEDKKAVDKFLEKFSEKLPQWKKQALDDPKWGKSGWETIKKIYQQAVKDKMDQTIREDRRKIMRGEDEEGLDWLRTKAANILFPRATKAGEEGRDPTAGELGRDIAANALYAVPFGTITKPLAYGRPIASKVLSWGSNAIAPTVVAAADNIADPENRDFDELSTDILIGTGANMGLNKAIAPLLARVLNAGQIRGGISPALRAVLEGTATEKEVAKNAVAAARQVMLDPLSTPAQQAAAKEILDLAAAASPNAVKVVAPALKQAEAEAKALAKQNKQAIKEGGNIVVGGVDKPGVVGKALDTYLNEVVEGAAPRYSEVLAQRPQMAGLFVRDPLVPVGAMEKTYVGNQIGSNFEKAADVGLDIIPGAVPAAKLQEKTEKNRAQKSHKAKVSDILAAPGADDEDVKWLTIVKDNPKVLQYGYADDPEGFKRWMLTRGNDLLRGTPLYRPAWEAE